MSAEQGSADSPPGPGIRASCRKCPRTCVALAHDFSAGKRHSPASRAALELHGLTGFGLSELVAFRPQRLALHELLIRVTADFAVPDGSRIEDLGINFRRMASRLLIALPRSGDGRHHPGLRRRLAAR